MTVQWVFKDENGAISMQEIAYVVIWTEAKHDLGVDVAASEAGGLEIVDSAKDGGEDMGCGNDLRRKAQLGMTGGVQGLCGCLYGACVEEGIFEVGVAIEELLA